MYGHREIWDFGNYSTNTVKAIKKHLDALEKLGFPMGSDEMHAELRAELETRTLRRRRKR